MRERINRLAKGIVDAEHGRLKIRPLSIQDKVQAGELTAKELYMADAEGRFVKGLIYSSDKRVRLASEAFGGIRNRVAYEVDSHYLTAGDQIEGYFSLVTNAGEYQVPFVFSVELGASAQILEMLRTPIDFAAIAKDDPERALRLFEYRDFADAPFMQDLHTRALYDGLKGKPDRFNAMEEFLVALSVKEPVELQVDSVLCSFSVSDQPQEAVLRVRCSTWGYLRFTVRADGDFIDLPGQVFGPDDFADGVCEVPYVIQPSRLHAGRNLGALTVMGVRESRTVRLEVSGSTEHRSNTRGRVPVDYSRYFELRMEYEIGLYEDRLLLNQMKQEVDRIRREYGETLVNTLMDAELSLMDGQTERASMLLESRRGEMAEHRQERYVEYCCYTYLRLRLQERDGQRETLLRLVKKYLSEDPSGCLFLLRMKLEPEWSEDLSGVLDEMRQMFARGCHSPFLYAAAFKIYLESPQLLQRMDNLELQVMMFAARHDLMNHDLALRVAELAGAKKYFHRLYSRLLVMLYEKYREKPFLAAVCGMLIRGDCRGSEYFSWYEKALDQKISLTRLYEYYLYALPQDYAYLLPKEVLMYFSYEKSMDDYSRTVLYTNILKYMKPDAPLYQQYERDIEQFTMEQLLKSRINRRLVVLYQRMIYREMIDKKVAQVLPAILKSFRIRLKNPNMKYVVVCYEELQEEDAFPIRDGVVYVPLFMERSVLLFQDEFGNRYANIPYRKSPAMEKAGIQDLEEQCYEICPNHPMLRLQECGEIMEAGIQNGADAEVLRRATETMPLKPIYCRRMISKMIRYHRDQVAKNKNGADAGYLLGLDLESMEREDRCAVCEALIGQEYDQEAWNIIETYGYEGISDDCLLQVCSRMILHQLFDEQDDILTLAGRLFERGQWDGVLLDYLCEHFNGSSDQMYRILEKGIQEHVERYDMPERLLAQMLFTGDGGSIDQVFDWYTAGKRSGDSLVKAYFTLKSADYFLKERPTDDRVFSYLEGAVHGTADLGRVPTIYLLALCRYYATLETLDEERSRLCGRMAELLISEKRIFSWFHDLGRLIPMPDTVMDRVILEHHVVQDIEPEIEIRILPEEEAFHPDKMSRVYAGIYVLQKVLFDGETLEYRITEQTEAENPTVKTGTLSGKPGGTISGKNRFTLLNEMVCCFAQKDEAALKEKMKNYLIEECAMEDLFPLM